MQNSRDLEWAAGQLDEIAVLLECLEFSDIASSIHDAHERLAAYIITSKQMSIPDRQPAQPQMCP